MLGRNFFTQTQMLRLVLLGILPWIIAAQDMYYCQWSPIASTLLLDTASYYGLWLFTSDTCSGTSCTIPAKFGGTSDVEYTRPSSSLVYTCDASIQYARVSPGSDGGVAQVGYIFACHGTSLSTSLLVRYNSGATRPLSCQDSALEGNYCGPFSIVPYYCTSSGSYNINGDTGGFSDCARFLSCGQDGLCISNSSDSRGKIEQGRDTCDGSISSKSGTIIVGGTSGTSGTTHSCHDCSSNPLENESCASQYGNLADSDAESSSSGAQARQTASTASSTFNAAHGLSSSATTQASSASTTSALRVPTAQVQTITPLTTSVAASAMSPLPTTSGANMAWRVTMPFHWAIVFVALSVMPFVLLV